MKKLALIAYFFFLNSSLFAQTLNVDSLSAILLARNKGVTMNVSPNRDSILKLIPVTKNPSARIRLIYDVIERGGQLNVKDAFYYHNKILEITRQNNDPVGEAVTLGELGYTVSKNGDVQEGLKILYKALDIAEKSGDPTAIGSVYDNLGVCIRNDDLKKIYFHKALIYSRAGGDEEFVCFELGNLSSVFSHNNELDSSRFYTMKAFEIAMQKNLQITLPNMLSDLAEWQQDPGNKLKLLRAALQMPFAKVDANSQVNIFLSIAGVYKKENKPDSAMLYAKNAYQASLNGLLSGKIGPSHLLSDLYKANNADSCLKYTIIYYDIRDSVTNNDKIVRAQAMAFSQQQKTQEEAMEKKAYQTKLWSWFFAAIILFLLVITFIFWRNNWLKMKSNKVLEKTLSDLKSTQIQLIQSEKMASLGELTAGIAHEIQNPLNFVNNFSEVNAELIEELVEEVNKGNTAEVKVIANDIKDNEQKINHHGKRADAIVKGMLQHSRSSTGQKEPTDINALADEYLRLAYHGLRAKDKSFNATLKTDFDETIGKINIIPQDIGRVILNLITNAFYAVDEKKKQSNNEYQPTVTVSTNCSPLLRRGVGGEVQIKVADNGNGIPKNIVDKIFQPFFTTKPTGQGTGLGLSLAYDIVKAHGGELKVEVKENEGSTFIIQLPVSNV